MYDKMPWICGSLFQYYREPEPLLSPTAEKERIPPEHCYLMHYRIEGRTAYVDAIYHQLQDYENIFADESSLQ